MCPIEGDEEGQCGSVDTIKSPQHAFNPHHSLVCELLNEFLNQVEWKFSGIHYTLNKIQGE